MPAPPLQGWCEGRVTFQPTYKVRLGTEIYIGNDEAMAAAASTAEAADANSTSLTMLTEGSSANKAAAAAAAKKRRTPAWCDRVLWRDAATMAAANQSPAAAADGSDGAKEGQALLSQIGYWRGSLTISDHLPVRFSGCCTDTDMTG